LTLAIMRIVIALCLFAFLVLVTATQDDVESGLRRVERESVAEAGQQNKGRKNRKSKKRKSKKARKMNKNKNKKNKNRKNKKSRRVGKFRGLEKGRQAPQFGTGCQYVNLLEILSKGNDCSNGKKFVLKGQNARRQFLIVEDKVILAYVNIGTKFTACTSFEDVTSGVNCKVVDGLSNVNLEGSSQASTTTTTSTSTSTTATTAAATTAAAATTDAAATTVADDAITTRVKGYIDAGTCNSISSNSNCGTGATSYYKSFTYNGNNVIISSQVPDHPAENDPLQSNPNTRCERWQYVVLPADPTKASSGSATSLGTTGLAVTGGAFFNDLSSPAGDLALYNEGASLDSCLGHSAPGGAYHYHANINCTNAGAASGSTNPDTCLLIGYMLDGVPMYGFCKDSSGVQFQSCYKLTANANTGSVETSSGSYTNIGRTQSDYEYDSAGFAAGTCQLDEGNGAIHPTTGKYSYFATTDYPYVPIIYYGNEGKKTACSAA